MKRYNNLYDKIYDMDNIRLAHKNAKRHKGYYGEVKKVMLDEEKYLLQIHDMLKNKTFKNGKYTIFKKQFADKIRTIYKLPYFPDRIIHHCVIQILGPIWEKTFIHNTFSSIVGRGIGKAIKTIQKDLHDPSIKYCLKMDIKKFYPSVNHGILKTLLRKKIKDKDVLDLLDIIIDSASGIPIGNYLSQFSGNIYLTPFDHYMKEDLKCKHYYRYCDDIVVLSDDKCFLHNVFNKANTYLRYNNLLTIKHNYQIFPISARGVDFLGYVIYNYCTYIRKNMKNRFKKKVKEICLHRSVMPKTKIVNSIMSYYGWFKPANTHNLWNKYIDYDMNVILLNNGLTKRRTL